MTRTTTITRSMRRRALLTAVCLMPSVFVASQQSRDTTNILTTGTAAISGTLVTDDETAAPVRRATITLTGDVAAMRLIAITDDAGKFAFMSLPAGRYSLSAEKAGYLPSAYLSKRPGGSGVPIVVADGQRVTGLTMKLLKGSVLTGTVRDENGRPVPDVMVTALHYATSFDGERVLQGATYGSSQVTDDRGMYRIYGLAPGEYLVQASASLLPNANPREGTAIHQVTDADVQRAQRLLREPGSTATIQPVKPMGADSARQSAPTVTYAPVYHPAAIAVADATTIALGPREERSGVDVLLRMVPTARVDGVTAGPDGAPLGGVSLTMMDPRPLPSGSLLSSLRNARSDQEGRFVMTGLSPGRYTINASGFPGQVSRVGSGDVPASVIWGMVDVSMDGRDVTTSIVLSPGPAVSGRMVFEGKVAPPDVTTVNLILLHTPISMGGGGGRDIAPDGSFVFSSVAPGKYRLIVNGRPPAGWLLKSAMVNGVDVSDIPLEIKPNENVDGAVVTFIDQRTEISGTMHDPAGKPAPEYTIVVYSADKRFWVPRTRRTQEVRPDADGRFVIRDLPAGDYLISALTDVEDGQWNDPAFLAELAGQGPIKITLADGEKKVQDIRVGGR